MLVSTTILSNVSSDRFKEDAGRVIDVIAAAYKVEEQDVLLCKKVILSDLIKLSLSTDRFAAYRSRSLSGDYNETDVLFDMKSDVFASFESIVKKNPDVNPNWFDFSHYIAYHPVVRYNIMRITASCGDLTANRQVGIMSLIGLGCDVDIPGAIDRFHQCVLWGDLPSLQLLAYAYHLIGNDKLSEDYYTIALLADRYIMSGHTELPSAEKARYAGVSKTFSVISSIYFDIVRAYMPAHMDLSFIEAIRSPKLSYAEVMSYVNNYATNQSWREVTNPSVPKPDKLGF